MTITSCNEQFVTIWLQFAQIDALMFVKGSDGVLAVTVLGVVGWCSDRVIAGLRTRQGWASVMARKLLLGHASRSEMRPGTADESLASMIQGAREVCY